MRPGGIIVICGQISGYNEGHKPIKVRSPSPPQVLSQHQFPLPPPHLFINALPLTLAQNVPLILFRQLHVHGFNVTHLSHKYASQFYDTIPALIAEGKIKLREDVYKGLEEAPKALVDVLKGANKGKAVVVLEE